MQDSANLNDLYYGYGSISTAGLRLDDEYVKNLCREVFREEMLPVLKVLKEIDTEWDMMSEDRRKLRVESAINALEGKTEKGTE